jgi:hypothetical protein
MDVMISPYHDMPEKTSKQFSCELARFDVPPLFNMKLSMTGRTQSLEFQETGAPPIAATTFVIYIDTRFVRTGRECEERVLRPCNLTP